MQTRVVLPAACLILAPLALLGWLGVRMARDEEQAVRASVARLLLARLQETARPLERLIESRERELLGVTDLPDREPSTLRRIGRTHPLVRVAFVLDPAGKLVHPHPARPRTPVEQELLDRVASMRLGQELGFEPPAETRAQGTARAPRSGWYVWFLGHDVNLIFWRRAKDSYLVGVELEPARLLADMIAELPATIESQQGDAALSLTDLRGREVYRWGGYRPPPGQEPAARLSLAHPLDCWQLRIHVPPGVAAGSISPVSRFAIAAGVGSVALALVLIAAYMLREYSRELDEAGQRVNFVNQVSHELRTPLTNIRMYAELLERHLPDDDPKLGEYASIVVAESERLSRLIANVLTFARKSRDTLAVRPVPARPDDVIASIVSSFTPTLAARGIEVELVAGAGRTVAVDADALGQILGNLLSNVEKYAAAGRHVSIRSGQDDRTTTVIVADRGPGIAPCDEERVFAPFQRGSDRITEGVAGTGIGLTIARDLARLHGGDLVVARPGSGAGAELVLTLATAPVEESR